MLLTVIGVGLAIAGGAYLWFHETVSGLRAHSEDVKIAQKELNVSLPGHAGDRARRSATTSGPASRYSSVSRSDTVMLIRADPVTKTISLLSIPRDLGVPIYCPRQATHASASTGSTPPTPTAARPAPSTPSST